MRIDVVATEGSIGLRGKREYCRTLSISPEIRKGEKHQTLKFMLSISYGMRHFSR